MAGRFGPNDFAACARCGGGKVHPKLLVMGPIAGIDSDSRSYVCRECDHEGLPIFFDTAEARAQFGREKRGLWPAEPTSAKKGVLSIPILPIQTEPLIDVKILDLVPIRIASVTGVRWEGGRLQPTAYRANPNFDVTRHLVKRCDVWLDSGGREPEEVMDGYMLDVERVVAGSKTLVGVGAFAGLYGLSSEVLPCLDWDGRVVWGDRRKPQVELRDVAKRLRSIGFPSLCVMDLRRLGTELGPDPELLALLEGLDAELYVGGGVQETDVAALGERGFAGGLVDPYTPVIRDLMRPPKEQSTTEASAPAPVPRPPPAPDAVPGPG